MVSRMNDCQLLFDVGGTFLKAVIADSDRKLIEDAEYEVLMPSSGSRWMKSTGSAPSLLLLAVRTKLPCEFTDLVDHAADRLNRV